MKNLKLFVASQQLIENTTCPVSSAIISITSRSGTPAKIPQTDMVTEILFLQFDDISRTDLNLDEDVFMLFNRTHARKIIDFVEKHKDKLIICQCEAGISRSAGTAAALSKIYNGDDTFYFKRYHPNSLVYSEILKEYYNVY